MLFWPMQQELDCVNESGQVVGKIKFDGSSNQYCFQPIDDSVALSQDEEMRVIERLAGLASGKYTIPMQDDD